MAENRRISSSTINLINSLLIILLIAGGWLVLKPKYDEWQETRPQAEAVATQLDSKQKTLDQVKGLLSSHRSLQDQLEVLDDALPSSPQIPQLLTNLEGLAEASGMNIVDLKVTELTDNDLKNLRVNDSNNSLASLAIAGAPQLVPIRINLMVSGPGELFDPFLRSIESNLRLLEVEILTVTPGKEGFPQYEFVIETLYQK